MRLQSTPTILFATAILAAILAVGYLVTRPTGSVITDATIGSAAITPNADHNGDATTIHYRVRRESTVSVYLEGEDGQRYYFRRDESRSPGVYDVLFSGIVEPFEITGENVKGAVLQRLIPNGEYTWVIEATDTYGKTDQATGTLEVADADTDLPDILEFSVAPQTFTPNQDGIDDRVKINVYSAKPATLLVYLIDEAGHRIFIPEFEGERAPGEEGRHSFEYDGGIDNGSDPPPDGTYQVEVVAQDAEGQKVQVNSQLTIKDGGVPLADVLAQPVGDTVRFSAESVIVDDVLLFELTVENYGNAPIRTTGPEPGYIYDQDDVFGVTGFFVESGAWRIAIDCDTCLRNYPWRWGLGTKESLTPIESGGKTHYYLMPGKRAIVNGGIRLHNIISSRNPQQFWAGLIHEDVGIALRNDFVDPHWIEIVPRTAQAAPTP